MASVRYFWLLLIGTVALNALPVSARSAQQATAQPLVLQGKCTVADKSEACTSCAVAVGQDFKEPAGDQVLTGSCPNMAAGRYRLRVAVPVELVPAQPASTIFAQLQESFGATSRDQSGGARDALADTPPVTWSWWGSLLAIDQTTPVTISRDAGVDITVKLRDVRYFVPRQTQGPAHRDGDLVMQKGGLFSLERLPAPDFAGSRTADLGAPREFSAKTLAAVVPGRTTRKQVEALLGEPWRTVAPDADEKDSVPESWEYRGRDAGGIYRVHIEFDDRGTTSLIVKVPDQAGTTIPIVAKTSAGSAKP